MLMKSAFVKYFANSRSVAAFLANEESLATALFKLLVTIEELLVLAPKTASQRIFSFVVVLSKDLSQSSTVSLRVTE